MQQIHTDVAILGAGTAGLNARRAVAHEGRSAVMVDPGPYGTTCARVGCMPSKLLIAPAEAVHTAQKGSIFGFEANIAIDGRAIMARVRRERDRFVGFVNSALDEHFDNGQLQRGRGRLIGPHTLRVSDPSGTDFAEVHFESLVVATGSSPWVPKAYRSLGELLLDNASIFELEDIPDSVFVVGPGVIGLELGQALHRLGSRVRIVGRSGSIGPLRDPKMRQHAIEAFSEELDLHCETSDLTVERRKDGAWIRFATPDGSVHEGTYSRVLVATGRRPNLHGLGLEHAGITLGDDMRVDYDPLTMQIQDSHVFIAGDVNSDLPLLHEAADDGRFAGTNAARFPEVDMHPRRTPLGIVFSDPQIATVGQPWTQMSCKGHRVGEVSYRDQGRARVMARNKGHVRIYAEAGTGRLLGAEMLGPDVEHTGHLLAWAVQQRMTVDQALEMPFYHPVVEEGIRTALRDLRLNLRAARRTDSRCDDFEPGQ